MLQIIYGFSQKIRMDEFSSKMACVTTRKMKILETLEIRVKQSKHLFENRYSTQNDQKII